MRESDLEQYRALAGAYLDLATAHDVGRDEQDPIYKAITEHRDFGAGYSSCGDLAHWLLYRLGVRASWLNRAEYKGWQVGANISRLCWKCPAARTVRPVENFKAGDLLFIWNEDTGRDAHVLVARRQVGPLIESADYGQPGGKRRTRLLKHGLLGDRKLQRVIPLADVLDQAQSAGELEPSDAVADWLDEMNEPTRPSIGGLTQRRPTLRRGSRGQDVKYLQLQLGLTQDGWFGPITERTVRNFQTRNGLTVDGVCGRQTWEALA